jgi:hypothetical protein
MGELVELNAYHEDESGEISYITLSEAKNHIPLIYYLLLGNAEITVDSSGDEPTYSTRTASSNSYTIFAKRTITETTHRPHASYRVN